MSVLVNQVVKGISMLKKKPNASNIAMVKAILDICDALHKGGRVKGYKSTDIPSDEKYEELKQLYESVIEAKENVIQEQPVDIIDPNKQLVIQMDIDGKLAQQKQRYQRKGQKHEAYIGTYAKLDRSEHQPILIMDGIELPKEIPTIPNDCILMPKFDGCTIAIAFNEETITVAHTRGVDSTTGDRKINYVTDKMNLLLNPKDAFDNLRKSTYLDLLVKDNAKLGNSNTPIKSRIQSKYIVELRIRAECVKKDKNTPDTATGFVAGGINGKLKTFQDRLDNLCLRPFEIGLIKYKDPISNDIIDIVPTQGTALDLLSKMKLLNFTPIHAKSIDASYKFIDLLDHLQETYNEPLDGIVYCSANWTYPYVTEESSKRVNYSKYKFKRNNIVQSSLLGISYSIGATGKYTPTLEYETVMINDKRYHQAKMAVKRIQDFGQIYVGQPCDIELKADINPMVVAVYDPPNTKEPITLIRKCLHCHKQLQYNSNKQGDVVISCVNPSCVGVIRQRIIKFLNAIKYKGISEKTLINDNVSDINAVIFKVTKTSKPIKEYLKNITVMDIYIGCSLCTNANAKKIVPNTSLTIRHWNQIREDLLKNHGSDIFIKQIIKFLDREVRSVD
jgi:hypothetical protein